MQATTTCGGNKLCATLVWLDHPIDPATGKPKTDRLNPDPPERSRLIGLQVSERPRARRATPNTWSGRVYNADDSHHYHKAHLKVESDGVAEVARLRSCPCCAEPTPGHAGTN